MALTSRENNINTKLDLKNNMNSSTYKKIIAPFLLILFSLLANIAYAVDIPSTAELLGKTPAGDKSVEIFTHLLGPFFTSPLTQVGAPTTLIGRLFLIFNSGLFVVGMIWAGYGLIGGIAETAHSGKVLGQRLSAVWLPIRMVTGIAGIVPVFAGFSLAQVLIVTMSTIGIAIGNSMWVGAVEAVDQFVEISPPMTAATATGSINFKKAGEDLFLMHVCILASKDYETELQNNGQVDINRIVSISNTLPVGIATPAVAISGSSKAYPNVCGRSSLESTNAPGRSGTALGFRVASVNYDAYTARVVNSYINAFPTFNTAIEASAQTWYTDRKAALNVINSVTPSYPSEEIDKAVQIYSTAIQRNAESVAKDIIAAGNSGITKTALDNMKSLGWIGAGSWYSTFAEANAAMVEAMNSVKYTSIPPSTALPSPFGQYVIDQLNALPASKTASKSADDAEVDKATGDGNAFAEIGNWVCNKTALKSICGGGTTATGNLSFGQAMVKHAIEAAAIGSGGGNLISPIVMFKNLGDSCIILGESYYALTGAYELFKSDETAAETAKAAEAQQKQVVEDSKSPWWSKTVKWITSKVMSAVAASWQFLKFAAPYLIVVGGLMAIYIPMIPFLTWMGAVVQYAVVVCQGLVGAPIAALSHLESEGEGLGRRTEAGYMFILNVTFRPALMLFGFFLASSLLIVIGTLEADLFVTAMASAQGNSVTGIVSFIGYITIFLVMNITLIQSLFNMIFLLPDQVLGLIGSAGAMTDMGKDTESKVHGVFVGGTKTMQAGATGAMASMKQDKAAAAQALRQSEMSAVKTNGGKSGPN